MSSSPGSPQIPGRDVAEAARAAAQRARRPGGDVGRTLGGTGGVDPARVRRLTDLAAPHLPFGRPARDGDCTTTAPAVTATLFAAGEDSAITAWLNGWLDADCRHLAFGHAVTLLDADTTAPLVVDTTATQFRRDLPAVWIAPLADYTADLAEATGVHTVTVGVPDDLPTDHPQEL